MAGTNWKQEAEARERREEVLRAIRDLTAQNGFPPSRAEIVAATKLSESTVRTHINKLIEDGRLERVGTRGMLRLPD